MGEELGGTYEPPDPKKYRYVRFEDAVTYYSPPRTRWQKMKYRIEERWHGFRRSWDKAYREREDIRRRGEKCGVLTNCTCVPDRIEPVPEGLSIEDEYQARINATMDYFGRAIDRDYFGDYCPLHGEIK